MEHQARHAGIILGIAAAAWWLLWLLNPANAAVLPLWVLLVLAQLISMAQVAGYWHAIWHRDRRPAPTVVPGGSTDVFICTLDEAPALVERTVIAAMAMNGEHRVFVLDDGNRPAMAELAARHGATWLPREVRRGAKAGNINSALSRTTGDYILVLDADHRPRAQMLERLLPWMSDPGVGFVQAPQYYINERESFVAGGAMEQLEIFFGPIMEGKDGLDAVPLCGTNVLIRRRALEDVGGFQEDSITEDLATSILIHDRGWRSRFVHERLADGLAPHDLNAFIVQQRRWARGNLEVLFRGLRRVTHLPWQVRLQYAWSSGQYISALAIAVYLTLPVLYLAFGIDTIKDDPDGFLIHFSPYIVLLLVILVLSNNGRLRLRPIGLAFGLFPVYISSLAALALRRGTRFQVTPKTVTSEPRFRRLRVQLVILATTVVAGVIGLLNYHGTRTAYNLALSFMNMALLANVIVPALWQTRSRAERRRRGVSAALRLRIGLRAIHARGRVALAMLITLTAVAILLRFQWWWVQGFRLDEAQSLQHAAAPLRSLVDAYGIYHPSLFSPASQTDLHPPGYFFFMHLWIHFFGTSVAALRMPSEIAGVLCIPALWLLAKELYGRRVAFVATGIGALSPFWVWYSQEMRMYVIAVLFGIISTWGLVVAVRRRRAWGWIVFVLGSALGLYTHYFALILLAAQMVAVAPVVLRNWRRQLLPLALSMAATLALFSPWIRVVLVEHSAGPTPFFAPPSAYAPLSAFVTMTIGYLGAPVTMQVVAGWPLTILVGLTAGVLGSRLTWRAWFITSLILVPVAVLLLISAIRYPIFTERYLIAATPAIYIVLGLLLVRLFARGARVVAVVVVALTLLVTFTVQEVSPINPAREDYARAIDYISRYASADDAIAIDVAYAAQPYFYYVRKNLPAYELPVPVGQRLGAAGVTEALVAPRVQAITRGRAHLWVVYHLDTNDDPNYVLRHFLGRFSPHHQVIIGSDAPRETAGDIASFDTVQLVRYDLAPDPLPDRLTRPLTIAEKRALLGQSPTLRQPTRPPFAPYGSEVAWNDPPIGPPQPTAAWSLGAAPAGPAADLLLINPNEFQVFARVTPAGSDAPLSIALPASSETVVSGGEIAPAGAMTISSEYSLIVQRELRSEASLVIENPRIPKVT